MNQKISESVLNTLRIKKQAVNTLEKINPDDFTEVIKALLKCKGKIVVTGIGKSAIIASKIVATLNSTGSPAVYMHAADAIHGDLGIIQENDVVVCISNSGNTPEIKTLVPHLIRDNNTLIAISSNPSSHLVNAAQQRIIYEYAKEACPHNLAPTTSTTLQLIIGDALAIALLECKNFQEKDFAKFHPGGSLGKLYQRVGDLIKVNKCPTIAAHQNIREAIISITENMLGCTVVLEKGNIAGVITDGDIRRMLSSEDKLDLNSIQLKQIMSTNPVTVSEDEMASEALQKIRQNEISQLVVIDKDNNYKGILHIHNLINEGLT
ncbi:MAG: D-arabinose 5-phosphate isomerase [Flavobacteriaceae bacterium]|nr:D-arabinose 5-phosphate isomerase [Flavobacteriaceae bacterium]